MALPLPKVVSDVGPGGNIVTGMRGMNALSQDMFDTQIKGVQAKYAPLTTQADAASKLAYANLMGPQFMAKLMGNENLLANIPDNQKNAILQKLQQAGMGQGTGNALLNNPMFQNITQPSPRPSLTGFLSDHLRNIFGGGNQAQPAQPATPSQNVFLSGMKPGDSYTNQSGSEQNVNAPSYAGQTSQSGSSNNAYAYDANGNNIKASPQEVEAIANGGQAPSFAENAGSFAGTKEEGKELGKKRAEAIDEVGKQYTQDVEGMVPLQHLMDISQSPIFMNMRNSIPGFQELQLNTLKNFTGTPAQQKMIGDYIASAKSVVGSTVRSFAGRAMAKEFDFANQLKIGDNDNINVILGKLESLATFKQAAMERDKLAMHLMTQRHMNQGDAYAKANDLVDMKSVRNEISNQLQSPVRIKNKKTGETKYISPKEYNELIHKE